MSFHDNRTVGWVNPNNGVTFTRVRQFTCAMDNHQPLPRRVSGGVLEEWREPSGFLHSYGLVGWQEERDAIRAVYLIDDGVTVAPFYVAGYSQDQDRITLMEFPTDRTPQGDQKMRPDGRPVDHSTWLHGPVRAYHLKIVRD